MSNAKIEFNFARHAICLLLGISIVFPVVFQEIKFALLAVILFLSFLSFLKFTDQMIWSRDILVLGLLYAFFGIFWSFYGEVRGNPGAFRVLTVMVFYPIIFSFLTCFFELKDFSAGRAFFKSIGVILVFTQVFYVVSSFGLDGGFFYGFMSAIYGDVAVADSGDDYLLFTLPNVSSLIFFIPFFFVDAFFYKKTNKSSMFVLLVMMLVAILTGRRAIYMSFIFSVVLVFFLVFFSPSVRISGGMRRVVFLLVSIVIAGVFFIAPLQNEINFSVYADAIFSMFDFSGNESNLERVYQFDALIKGFYDTPLFGAGAGAAASYSRSYEQPWAYELFYLANLFQYGVVVFLCYIFGVLYIFTNMIRFFYGSKLSVEEKVFVLSFVAGCFAFLISTATNPYLGKFDYMWVLFVPLGMINAISVKGLSGEG